jgi:5-formyltetrahydrofolate cyclo-ligase
MKQLLRNQLLVKRRGIADKPLKDAAILSKLTALVQFQKAQTILTYVSTAYEVDTLALIEHCFTLGKTVAVPVIVDEVMRFYEITGLKDFGDIGDEITDFSVGANVLCIVPALRFSESGFRLGYGGGYYDRFLGANDLFSAGLCYAELVGDVPAEPHDKRVDIVITEEKISGGQGFSVAQRLTDGNRS